MNPNPSLSHGTPANAASVTKGAPAAGSATTVPTMAPAAAAVSSAPATGRRWLDADTRQKLLAVSAVPHGSARKIAYLTMLRLKKNGAFSPRW